MWVERIQHLLPEARFEAPAEADAIAACESALGIALDADLAALLSETNGVGDQYAAD